MIQTSISSQQYIGNNSTVTPYPVSFLFYHDEDLVVTKRDTATGEETLMTLSTDYLVTGAGNPDGGNITTVVALPNTFTLSIVRSVPFTQLTSYEEGDSFPAKSHEAALDKLTMGLQQVARGMGVGGPDDLGTAFRLTDASGTIPPVGKVLDSMLGIDALGNTILRTPSDLLGWLGHVGTAWENATERNTTRGAYAGQLGVQKDNWTIYVAHSTAPGDWLPFLPGSGIVYATDGVPEMHPAPAGDLVGTTASQTLTNKTIVGSTVSGISGLTKADVGLGNVDNTSDVNKPVSAATNAALSTKQPYDEKGVANGYASLDATGKVPTEQIPGSGGGGGLIYKGSWNASTNTPAIPAAAVGNNGWFYVVSVAGTTSINGINVWAVGDWITSNGTVWQKIPQTDAVSSVNGRTGAVVVTKTDVGLANVDNTSDATKNSATAVLTNKTIVGADQTLMQVRLDADVVNNLPVTRLNNGTGAGPTTAWFGDNTWKTPSGTGDVTGPAGSTDGELLVASGTTGKVLKRYAAGTGFAKVQNNAAITPQALILPGDLDPNVIHGQTNKATALLDADEFLVWDSSVSALRRVAAPLVRYLPGETVQTVYAELTSELTTTLEISTPLNITKGVEILSAAITLKYANSKVLLTSTGPVSHYGSPTGVGRAVFMAFIAGTTLTIGATVIDNYADGVTSYPYNLSIMHTPGSVGPLTYSVRMASITDATRTFNLYVPGYQFVSGSYFPRCTLILQEIKQ